MKRTIFFLLPFIFIIFTSCASHKIVRNVQDNILYSSSHPKANIEISPEFKHIKTRKNKQKREASNANELPFKRDRFLTDVDKHTFVSYDDDEITEKYIVIKFIDFDADIRFLGGSIKNKHTLDSGNTYLYGNAFQYQTEAYSRNSDETSKNNSIQDRNCFLFKAFARSVKNTSMQIYYAERINNSTDYNFKCSDWDGSAPLTKHQNTRLREFNDRSKSAFIITPNTAAISAEEQGAERKVSWEDRTEFASTPTFWFDKAHKLYESKEYEEAVKHFSKAIELDSEYARAYNYRGWAHRLIKAYTKAIKDYDKVVEILPSYYRVYNTMGIVYKIMENYDKAIESYKKSISVNPKYKHPYNNLGWVYYKLGNYQESIDYYNKALECDPKYIAPYNNLGIVHIELGDFEKAMESLNSALEINPKYKYAYLNMARIYSLQNQTEKACISLEDSITKGYNGWEWIKGEDDFDNIRNADCYKNIMDNK